MTPLLQALAAASKVGFDAPECPDCYKSRHCPACRGTGFDADPDRLVSRALGWFHDRVIDVTFQWATDGIILSRDVPISVLPPPGRAPQDSERHNGTTESRAVALLTLIARVGSQT
jgi:hypothetical protein